MNTEVQKALESLKNPSRLISEYRESVTVYADELRVLVEWAETQIKDTLSALKIGDRVEVLIDDAVLTDKGARGVVEGFRGESYPIMVRFREKSYPVGFNRNELALLVREG